ncbi:MAG: hypothetical protein IJ690_05750 [Clostridia bacterium]|nr:hypothetical protein [Clostridia bacterium]
MNKTEFIKELTEKTGYDEEKCIVINSIIEDTFFVGVNNKEKMKAKLIEKMGVSEEEADKIYNSAMEIIARGMLNKMIHPFNKKDNKDN